jgi:hypothetical protein
MVAASFSWPVATAVVRVAKVILAQELSQAVLSGRVILRLGVTGLAGAGQQVAPLYHWLRSVRQGARSSQMCCGAPSVEGKLLGFDRISQRAPIP